ncbi:SusD/RagB family nutrient-binding outer membrane lipoprotein [Flavobacteriaceae bacterium F89]|uniref:SusD/RagB family nutrient-binding outer membrane lipoprotein n=1 Tax=Cerina litoralis TaxID=2874477 RepID=A0AAE3EXS1_9FLAO|nr:SusD/RagB family nutrient-binding outer membrane lipoprotein [Cerina litoralis]MCG2462213.1 SusD/RagB family nutrient-binding outer membrane lipoprotein [Cerina litoralis]
MDTFKKIIRVTLVGLTLMALSCDNDLVDTNLNPNGVNLSEANPSFLLTTVMSGITQDVGNKGFAEPLSAYMQYTQKDAWGNNNYDWEGGGWETYYDNLRTANLAYQRAEEMNLKFHQAVAMILKAHLFALLTDYYGDIPYSQALQGNDGVSLPQYDSQETVYKGVISDLEIASQLLSNNQGSLEVFIPEQDIYFHGDSKKWIKYANSLALRYYMRLSAKDPSYAGAGVQKTLAKPLIASVDDELAVPYLGISSNDSQPGNGKQGSPSSFTRIKPCNTLIEAMNALDDPRRNIWFAPVEVPIKVVPANEVPGGGDDVVVDGVRYINEATIDPGSESIYDPLTWYQDRVDGLTLIDTSSVYVGLPVSVMVQEPYTYNLNPQPVQGGGNVHVSLLNEQFNAVSGPNLKSRIFSYAEVCFLKAEAALKGWGTDAEGNYNKGIQASLDTWGIGDQYSDYIDNSEVAYDGTLTQVMEQKWIANFTSASEAYMDWRRTGLPDIQTGPYAKSSVIPVRFVYPSNERDNNGANYNAALSGLEATDHTDDVAGYVEDDTPWSKTWLLQGVSEPW